MKKVLLIGLCLLVISCAKNDIDYPDDTPSTLLLGKWKLVKTDFYSNDVLEETEINIQDNNTCPDYIEFKANRIRNLVSKDENCVITFTIVGQYVYNPTHQMLTITETSESFSVINLTNTDLITEKSYTESGIPKKKIIYYQKVI